MDGHLEFEIAQIKSSTSNSIGEERTPCYSTCSRLDIRVLPMNFPRLEAAELRAHQG